MEMIAGLCGVPVEEVTYFGAGINHQTFLYRLEHGGESLYPKLDEAIERNPDLLRRVRVDMYRRLGYFPTESSEHSAEYSPWYMRHDPRSSASASRSATTSGAARRAWRSTSGSSARSRPASRSRSSAAGSTRR